jgi:phosphatidylserine decarboxylase
VKPTDSRPLFATGQRLKLEFLATTVQPKRGTNLQMVKDGIPFVLVPGGLALVSFLFGWWWLGLIFLFLAAFMAFFFRDPERVIPADPDVVVAPADGRITRIAPAENESAGTTLVSIFLSPLDVHINRAPIAGRVTGILYRQGRFVMATRADASEVNEQNSLTFEGERITVVCRQIAGILARRIVCWKHEGDEVGLGERFGMIKFGSRTDLLLPANCNVLVREGMHVRGGTTVIGRIQ